MSNIRSMINTVQSTRQFPILLPVAFALSLYISRVFYSGTTYYGFLLWNLFLAYVPLWISTRIKTQNNPFLLLPAGIVWLLFLPNAPYIITDFIHLEAKHPVPIWFDLILILGFAILGLAFWLISMTQALQLIRKFQGGKYQNASTQILILLSAAGVYLGRYGRWNSWDVFTQPHLIIKQVLEMMLHPMEYPGFYGMTIILYAFLAFTFSFFKQSAEQHSQPIKSTTK